MTPYDLLSEPVRRYIRNKRWEALRPIQASAIAHIIPTDNNYILASRTASGKTEAAFLPILSKTNFNEVGVQVLYISPLIALINDQFYRVVDLCKSLEISVTKWHGEANRTQKNKLIKQPNGIVLITPESIEAMLVNAPYNVSTLFGNLSYIVIDEIHSFLGVDRGLHLMSLLSRIQQVNKTKITIIGLSATIGNDNYIEAKRLTGDIENTKILLDKTKKETIAKFKYFDNSTVELSIELLKDLYKETYSHKVLIFPNSRGRTEEIAVKLRKISDKVGGHKNYYAHHSSVDKEIRESVEHFAKNNERYNFCISCTSTLELGIDIGTVDKIVQVDSTHSVASLVQRIGRSGRRENEASIVDIYATDKWSMLQSLACWNLYKNDFLEPIVTAQKPYDILFHQMLSTVKQRSGCSQSVLLNHLKSNPTFVNFSDSEINSLLFESEQKNYIERIGQELIIGIDGERIVNTRDFYSVFKTEPSFKVVHGGRKIGEIPYSPQVKEDENILLAARTWKIKDVDIESSKISVIPTNDGKKPLFFGTGGNIHPKIREEMLRIVTCNESYEELDENCKSVLVELRSDFKIFAINNLLVDRPVIVKDESLVIYTFTGTKINKSLHFLFDLTGQLIKFDDHESFFELALSIEEFKEFISEINSLYRDIDNLLNFEISENESIMNFSKWGKYLPHRLQCEILKERYFDFKNAIAFLNNINLLPS